jgi:hypothetical protein
MKPLDFLPTPNIPIRTRGPSHGIPKYKSNIFHTYTISSFFMTTFCDILTIRETICCSERFHCQSSQSTLKNPKKFVNEHFTTQNQTLIRIGQQNSQPGCTETKTLKCVFDVVNLLSYNFVFCILYFVLCPLILPFISNVKNSVRFDKEKTICISLLCFEKPNKIYNWFVSKVFYQVIWFFENSVLFELRFLKVQNGQSFCNLLMHSLTFLSMRLTLRLWTLSLCVLMLLSLTLFMCFVNRIVFTVGRAFGVDKSSGSSQQHITIRICNFSFSFHKS